MSAVFASTLRASAASFTSRSALRTQFRPALFRPLAVTAPNQTSFSTISAKMAEQGTASGNPVSVLYSDKIPVIGAQCPTLFEAKKTKNLSFEAIGKALGRNEVACAALFYGQARATDEDIKNLSKLLDIPEATLQATEMTGMPDRGKTVEMPPREPMIYRLWEIVQNYGYAYKAVINEKFGDGIMSAISFSTKVEKDVDDKGEWVVITLRGKWLPFTRF